MSIPPDLGDRLPLLCTCAANAGNVSCMSVTSLDKLRLGDGGEGKEEEGEEKLVWKIDK